MFLSFVSIWDVEYADKEAEMCCDRWGDQDLVMFFDTYCTSVIAASLASIIRTKRRRCALSILAAIRCRVFDHF